MIRKLLIAFALLFPAAAQAEWREATSNNFVVYTEGSEQEARDFAAKLEKFNYVLRRYHNVREPAQVPRFRVFLLDSISAVQRMIDSGGVAGYYVPDARALMFVGTQNAATHRQLSPEQILFHEYVHHFMFQYFPATYPVWYSEGYAELWGTIEFLPDNVVEIGGYQEGRFRSLVQGRWVPLSRLLTARAYADIPDVDLIYTQGWLLNRYMFENAERRAQLQQYLRAINAGTPYDQAAREAFGDVGRLNSELFDYAGRGRYDIVRLPFRTLDVGPINVRTLGPAEQALLEQEIKLSQGVPHTEMADRAAAIRSIAGRFPNDPYALALLAEAEQLAGNLPAATVAANRLLEVAPNNARALMRKGLIEVAVLQANRSTDAAAWAAARRYLSRAMDAAPNDPLPHEAFYDSFTAQGVMPPDTAQNALYVAHELAPSDDELSYKLALDFERRDMVREAMAIIRPSAFQTRVRRGESESERRERERREDRYRRAGTTRHETALEMYNRLQTRLAAAQPQQPAAAAGAPPRQ
jgi:tetratricopeptide (TPR) repeat protein